MNSNRWKLAAFLLVIGVAITAFKLLGLGNYLTLDYFKSVQGQVEEFYGQNQLATVIAYLAIYILTAALSLPGATILTLIGGALFGFWLGLLLVSFASTLGATCAFLVARFLLRDAIQSRFSDKLAPINEGVRREGPFYLFALRLIPVFPFFVVNLVMALTPIRASAFYFVSQLGMLPGTMAYVNAGTQLSRISSLKGIVSPTVLASFAALGVVPLVAKKIITVVRSRQRRQA